MQSVDRLFRFLTVIALWLIAGMVYVAFFHEGGQFKLAAAAPPPPAQPPPPAIVFPAQFPVTNADGQPLRITGEVSLAKPAAPQPAPRLKISCKLRGAIVTAQPSFRLFSGDWKPDREWPLDAKIDCETVDHSQ